MTRGAFRIFSIAGIPVRIDWTFLVLLPLLALMFGYHFVAAAAFAGIPPSFVTGQPWLWGLGLAIALFASVLLHELAHVLYARASGGRVVDITLWLLGGVSRVADPPRAARHEALMAFVGPLTSFAIAGIAYLMYSAFDTASFSLRFAFFYLAYLNVVLGAFNLLPAFPMDGGRILRAALTPPLGRARATRAATTVGKVFAIAFAVFGVLGFNFMLLLVAFFVYLGAEAEGRHVELEGELAGVRVGAWMSPAPAAIDAGLCLADAIDQMKQTRRTTLPVSADDRVIGMLVLEDVRRIPVEEHEQRSARELARKVEPLDAQTEIVQALRRFDEHELQELPVVSGGRLVGVIGRDDIARGLELRDLDRRTPGPGKPSVVGVR